MENSPPLSLRRTPRKARGYIEPLLETENALPLHMVLIPGGTFTMGSPEDELDREDDEGPQREVTVPSFFMSRYPITQAQWRMIVDSMQGERELDPDPSRFKGDDHPVENVSWYEAVEFCDRLSNHTNRPYRLPSEAEWEYACRAGTTTPFYFGKTLTDELANYRATSTYNDGPAGQYRQKTTLVGSLLADAFGKPIPVGSLSADAFGKPLLNDSFPANAFGLSDMHGNVLEWCQDQYHSSYEGAPTDGAAWVDKNKNSSHVLRGGSWDDHPRYCRSAYRLRFNPVDRYSRIGFRVCCSAPR